MERLVRNKRPRTLQIKVGERQQRRRNTEKKNFVRNALLGLENDLDKPVDSRVFQLQPDSGLSR